MERSLPIRQGAGSTPNVDEQRYSRVEALLARYPALSDQELAELLEWFEREASAYDVGVIASNESIRGGYRRFRAEQLDSLSFKDVWRAIVFTVLAGSAIAAIVWLAN